MNYFTKDELKELHFFTSLHKNKYQVKYPQDLLDKLQSMIDNYCEHELCDIDYDHQPLRCRACKEIVE